MTQTVGFLFNGGLSPRHRLSFDRSDARPRLDRLASSPTGTGISVSKLTG
jgi:hypothetical protein